MLIKNIWISPLTNLISPILFMSRWNMTAEAARPNPPGTFNVTNVTLSQTFILQNSVAEIQGLPRYVVNNVSYYTQDTR